MMIGVGINMVGGRGGEKPFTPLSVGNMQLWLDSSSGTLDGTGSSVVIDGQPVQTWNDKSGNNAHAVQADIAKQPILRTGVNGLNGKPVLQFTQANLTHMVTPNISMRGLTVFMVASTTAVDSNLWMIGKTGAQPTVGGAHFRRVADDGKGAQFQGIFQKGTAQSYRTYNPYFGVSGTPSVNGFDLFAYRNDGTSNKPTLPPYSLWLGALLYSRGRLSPQQSEINGGPGVAQILVPVTVGAIYGGGSYFNGKFAELIVYDQNLSQADHQAVEDYLSAKWNIPLMR